MPEIPSNCIITFVFDCFECIRSQIFRCAGKGLLWISFHICIRTALHGEATNTGSSACACLRFEFDCGPIDSITSCQTIADIVVQSLRAFKMPKVSRSEKRWPEEEN